ncbi:MAG: hypothetical protein EXR74_08010 [Bdellovibrionales bacterium]|nr:hypothetical protein [Bdellovibrionales bacterium]
MKSILSLITWIIFLIGVISCNVYSPLNSNNSDLDKLEEAQKCLKDLNYNCAITQYQGIKDSDLKEQKLCQVYLTKGGVTLNTLINTISKNSSKMLGDLSKTFIPWTSQKLNDLELAKTHCVSFAETSKSGDQGVLLKTIAVFSDCAIRMARTEIFRATTEAQGCAIASSTTNGTLEVGDIGQSNGVIDSDNPGMCQSDVLACQADLGSLIEADLNNGGFPDLAGAIHLLPDGITSSSTTTIRAALRTTL